MREDEGEVTADLTLEIRVTGRAPYLWSEPHVHTAERMRVGRELAAKVDPTDPSFVLVCWDGKRWYSTRRL